MSSIIKVDTIQNQSGANIISESSNTITVGASGDTITVPSGATLTNAGTLTNTGTLTNSGSISGFGSIVQHIVGTSSAGYSNLGTTPGPTTTTTNLTNYSATITPTSTSNRLAFFCTLPYMVMGSYTGIVGLRIYDVTNAAVKGDNCFYHFEAGGHGGAGTAGKELPGYLNVWDITPASTSATQYCVRLSAYVQSGSNQVSVNSVNYNIYFNIIEYEQVQ